VYTQQYGWIWMPYADAYTSVPAGGYGAPYAYVYAPAYACWTWLAAPWIWGVGPWPAFGVYGAARFGWYGHGWWRYPAHWHYYAPGYAGHGYGPAYRSVPPYRPAPAPYRPYGSYRPGYGAWRGPVTQAPGVRAPSFSPVRAPAFSGHAPARAPVFSGHAGGWGSGRSSGGGHGGGGHGHGRG
jgi:hypothetical protein